MKNLAWWHGNTAGKIKSFMGHEGVVNAVDCSCVSPKLVVSASDGLKMWDARVKGATGTFEHDFPCTAYCRVWYGWK